MLSFAGIYLKWETKWSYCNVFSPYILWKMTHDHIWAYVILPINTNEDNASMFLFNAFMKKCSLSGKSFIQGSCLKTLMISEL